MKTLSIDIETYCDLSLQEVGVYKYAEDESFEVLLLSYSIDEGPVTVIDLARGEEIPEEILLAMEDKAIQKWAYNAQFERVCLSKYLKKESYLDPEQWYCDMAYAGMVGLPSSLDLVGKVLHLPLQKLTEGKLLINYFCIPCKPTRTNGGRIRNYPDHDIDKWNLFKKYNIRDVETELQIHKYCKKLFAFPISEHKIYAMDQRMNDRGVLVDKKLVDEILKYNDKYINRLTRKAMSITGLANPNSVAQLKCWFNDQGIDLESLTKDTVTDLLEDDSLPAEAHDLLQIRQEMSKSSVKKFTAMESCLCKDDRIHGMLQYYGANRTGRWSGRLVQLQNLKRNSYKELYHIRSLIKDSRAEDIELIYDGVSEPFSQLVRTAFIAPEGKTLCIADYSAIEARVIAWLANEKWVMDVFATTGKIYENTASKMFNVPLEEITHDSPLRAKGKIATLALGYGGSVGALIAMGAIKMGLEESELDDIVKKWRRANPHIVRLWNEVNDAVIYTLTNGGAPVKLNRGVSFKYDGKNLFIKLPTGRSLTYFNAKFDGRGITYETKDQTSGKWTLTRTFGGKLVENIVQAIARDCLATAMTRLEKAGYPIVFHVHDEVIVEGQKEDLEPIMDIMGQPLDWAEGLLLKAAGYTSDYYLKD